MTIPKIRLLDCTLRDGAYVVEGRFGDTAITGINRRLNDANVDIVECGWLKDSPYQDGTTYYHMPDDFTRYAPEHKRALYVAMIDYDRYDVSRLPECDGKSIDGIRVVFPKGKAAEGLKAAERVRQKGYRVFVQAANTLGYSDYELLDLVERLNDMAPEAVSVVDTFGAMRKKDLLHILSVIDRNMAPEIAIGFHSHNNRQLSYALSMEFVEYISSISERRMILDGSLCGMGRGAGNANTELVADYLNEAYHGNYDMDTILDTIDMYMLQFMQNYQWGYSIPYMLSGRYECHVNNVSYLLEKHRTRSKDMRRIFETLDVEKRRTYDYGNLEKIYMEYQDRTVDDTAVMKKLEGIFKGREVLAVLPGMSATLQRERVRSYIEACSPVVVGINAILPDYSYHYLFFSNAVRYEYAAGNYSDIFEKTDSIITSNIRTDGSEKEMVVNFNALKKGGWVHFDNSAIMFLRLMGKLQPDKVVFAGFDGYQKSARESYSDSAMQPYISEKDRNDMQREISEMLKDFALANAGKIKLEFITASQFEDCINI